MECVRAVRGRIDELIHFFAFYFGLRYITQLTTFAL